MNRTALVGGAPKRLSFPDIDRAVDGLAAGFLDLGLHKGDVVAAQMPNIVEGVLLLLACARLGLILCPVPMQYREHELRHILGLVDARMFVTVPELHGFAHAAMALGLQDELPGIAHVGVFGAGVPLGAVRLDDLLAGRADRAAVLDYSAKNPIDPMEVFTICWTSGTEAKPKGVPRNHAQWMANMVACVECGDLKPGDRLLSPFPMVNVAAIGGLVLPWLQTQGVLAQHHPFDLPTFLRQIAEEKINYTIAPPAILNMLLKNDAMLAQTDVSTMRTMGSGSAPLAPWMVKGWQERFGITVINIFGSNEGTSLFSTGHDIPDPEERAQYFPRFGVEGITWPSHCARMIRTRLVDPETEEEITAPNVPGELRIDGAMKFDGYWNSPDLNATAFDAQGYFKTGDTFEIAGDGERARYYHFVGRSKEIIIRGGVNISPAELDAVIESHPKLQEAACAGYVDDRLGERVCAVVVPKPGQDITLPELVDYLQSKQMAVYKLPERLMTMPALPRNALGKVVRRTLAVEVAKQIAAEMV
nr:AMP-binding protein [Govania unica]